MRRGTSAARAAALLLIASGASGAVSAWFPAIDARWIFVAAIAAIALLEGFLAGLIAIWIAVAAHLLLHGGDSSLIIAGGSAAVLIGGFIHSRQRPVSLPPTPSDVEDEPAIARLSMSENDRKLGERIADLEADVASRDAALTRQLSRIAALDSKLAEANARAGDVESQLTEAGERWAQSERQVAEQRQRDAARIAELEPQLAEAIERSEAAAARVNSLEERALHTNAALETARAASASLAARVEELEQAIDAADSLLVSQRQDAASCVASSKKKTRSAASF